MTSESSTLADRAALRAASPSRTTRGLLVCGALAGPVFVVTVAAQAFTRDGYDLRRHPISLLTLGTLGWIQMSAFIGAGLLSAAYAVGLRRALRPGPAGAWVPPLVGVFGLGLIVGGGFRPDPALGFPPGAPAGNADPMSWHGIVHAVAPPLAFTALVLACFVVVRRAVVLRQPCWAAYSAATGMVALALVAWPGQEGLSVRLALAVTLAFAWTTTLALRLLSGDRVASSGPRRV
ncbi:Protein of unknown function [Micromonospora rhizosphaerae]|uniref:DUF998 domain-containing protein n=1 Tax=Micromonospora rhizosphaerae TaxID=568872 RepID=A0A1C6TDH0_9ACTN|nr:DUF998 domain-containing protein [Micromonospora rhizosphaerae]SCL39866.1 Protein of unknown function [Micromonospora rhizosphaerae]